MRPEFELLEQYLTRLYTDVDINQTSLRRIKNHIQLCASIVETDYDRSLILRTTNWWRNRAALFGMNMDQKLLFGSVPHILRKLTNADRRFLGSIYIAADGSFEDEDEDDGA